MHGQRWAAYGEQLEPNLREVADRLQWGAYQAAPVEPVDIPKAEGRQRPIGKPTLQDTIVLALPPRPRAPSAPLQPVGVARSKA